MKGRMVSRTAARCISVCWAGWWVFFAIASWTGEGAPAGQFLVPLVVSLCLSGSAFFAWKFERIGGALLALEGLVVIAGYPLIVNERFSLTTVLFVIGTLGVPPLIAGLLYVYSSGADQKPHPA